MSNSVSWAIAPAGYVRACFSKRARGHCLPLELVRRHLGAVNRSEFKRRVARAFSGYLVTDSEAGYPFRESRKNYAPKEVGVLRTGFAYVHGVGGELDAPEWIAAGGMYWIDGVGPFPDSCPRGGL